MRLSNKEIPEQWKAGLPARNYNNSFSTDGNYLYSYNKIVGITLFNEKVLFDYSKEHFISQTTSTHVGYARQFANNVVSPEQESAFMELI